MVAAPRIVLVLLLAAGGALAKVLGGFLYGSRALMVDALTSIANMLALLGTVYYYRQSLMPPDEDHHYGHHRLSLGGVFVTLMTYSFVAGLAVAELLFTRSYSVDVKAPLAAAVGLALYSGAILVARRAGPQFSPYSVFTVSELIEGATVIAASFGGALYSYVIDLAGAYLVTAYIFYELYDVSQDFMRKMSDVAPPPGFVQQVVRDIESVTPGVKVKKIRLRCVTPGRYQGDVVIGMDPSKSVVEAHVVAQRIERVVRHRYGLDLVIHIEPLEQCRRGR
ncbi:MAG: cation transporter [Thermoprotei archaeon]|nr:MAG: cation transporter [Thermoprotei archaeon]